MLSDKPLKSKQHLNKTPKAKAKCRPPLIKKTNQKPPKRTNNLSGLTSPKTLSYSKVMEKYGDIVDSDLSYNNVYPTKEKENIQSNPKPRSSRAHSYINKTYENQDHSDISTYSDRRSKSKSKKTKCKTWNPWPTEPPQDTDSKASRIINQLQVDLVEAEQKIIKLEHEKVKLEKTVQEWDLKNYYNVTMNNNNTLNDNSKVRSDKVQILLKWLKKYSKKFLQLIPWCHYSNSKANTSNEAYNELKQTIEQYHSTVHSDKITKALNLTWTHENDDMNSELNFAEFLGGDSSLVYDKQDYQLQSIIKENTIWKEKIIWTQNKSKADLIKLQEENKKLSNDKNKLLEYGEQYKAWSKDVKSKDDLIKELEMKWKYTQEWNTKLKLELGRYESELKYKDKTISFLEEVLHKFKVNPEAFSGVLRSNTGTSNIKISGYTNLENRYENYKEEDSVNYEDVFIARDSYVNNTNSNGNCDMNWNSKPISNTNKTKGFINSEVNTGEIDTINEDQNQEDNTISKHNQNETWWSAVQVGTCNKDENINDNTSSVTLKISPKLPLRHSPQSGDPVNKSNKITKSGKLSKEVKDQPECLQNDIDDLDKEISTWKNKAEINDQ